MCVIVPTDFICTSISIFAYNKWEPSSLPDKEHRLSKMSWKEWRSNAYRQVIAQVPRIDQALGVAPTAICYQHCRTWCTLTSWNVLADTRCRYHTSPTLWLPSPCLTPIPLGLTRLHPHSATTPTLGSACVERSTRAWCTLVLSIAFCWK